VKLPNQPTPSPSVPAHSAPLQRQGVSAGAPRPTAPVGPAARRVARRLRDGAGFSLPEVLVVCLIVGILAAVVVPSLLATTSKATDAQAKELAHTAQSAAETYATDHGDSYANLSPSELEAEEPAIATAPSKEHAYLSAASGTATTYTVTATAANGDELTVARAEDGAIERTCHSSEHRCSEGETGSW
jgi:prepilin-type N-terminal cleavage/methylation domain-containing protein